MPDESAIAELTSVVRELADRVEAQTWPRWLTVDIAARYSSLSVKSIRNLVSAGRLNASRAVRGRLLIERQELDAVLAAGFGQQPRKGRGIRPNMR